MDGELGAAWGFPAAVESVCLPEDIHAEEWIFGSVPAASPFSALAIVIGLLLLYKLVQRLLFWRLVRRGSRIARVAASTLRALRAARPAFHPPTRHVWVSGEELDVAASPLLCVACCGHIAPLTPAQALNCCMACGSVAHDGCLRHVGDTCRPAATPPGPQQHFWMVAGTGRQERPPSSQQQDRAALPGGVAPCLFCEEEVAGGVWAAEPAWRCACCSVMTHVRCFCATHPHLPTVAAKFETRLRGAMGSGAGGGADGRLGRVKVGVGAGQGAAADPFHLDSPVMGTPVSVPTALGASPTAAATAARDFGELASPMANGAASTLQRDFEEWNLSEEEVDALDACSLGPMQRMILPSSCVKQAQSSDSEAASPDSPHGDGPGPALTRRPSVDIVARADSQSGAKRPNLATSASARRPSSSAAAGGTGSSAVRKRSWWRRALAPRQLQWSDWALRSLPPHCRPILVFVNVKSGPQVGEALHRRFLRVLHPLQVVCLPRDPPEPALRMFAFLPGVRILCVGGDGTAGWIMSCLDSLAEERRERRRRELEAARADGVGGEAAAVGEWTPPPVAIIPLGTGNDLARTLGWGGGYAGWRQEGAIGALQAVSQASVALLDRWTLTFTESGSGGSSGAGGSGEKKKEKEKEAEGSQEGDGSVHAAVAAAEGAAAGEAPAVPPLSLLSPEKDREKDRSASRRLSLLSPRALSSSLGAAAARASVSMAPPPPPPPAPTRRAMNNYLGIGVDAKVALEFHEMRETYPQWFQSQFGNKLVYTGVGALDIVSGPQLNLHAKMEVECDGEAVPLPLGAEGILIVNIPSYMGGVDLWGSGAGPGATPGTQSICDGMVEIVAVGGSWHLGQLQVGLSRAVRLRQGRRVVVRSREALPMQIDGEPFVQPAGEVAVELRGQARVLRRVESKPVAKLIRAVEDALEAAAEGGVISPAQHDALAREMASRLHPQL